MSFWTSIVDWFTAFYPIFAAIAAVGSIVAIIFLWLNLVQMRKQLKEMKEQKELEYKGFLVINLFKIEGLGKSADADTDYFKLHYFFPKANNRPILLKNSTWKITKDCDVNVERWFNEVKVNSKNYSRGPIIQGISYHFVLKAPDFMKDWLRWVLNKPYPSQERPFFVHCLYEYEDVLGCNYWIYMKWFSKYVTDKTINGEKQEEIKISGSIYLEEYRRLN